MLPLQRILEPLTISQVSGNKRANLEFIHCKQIPQTRETHHSKLQRKLPSNAKTPGITSDGPHARGLEKRRQTHTLSVLHERDDAGDAVGGAGEHADGFEGRHWSTTKQTQRKLSAGIRAETESVWANASEEPRPPRSPVPRDGRKRAPPPNTATLPLLPSAIYPWPTFRFSQSTHGVANVGFQLQRTPTLHHSCFCALSAKYPV